VPEELLIVFVAGHAGPPACLVQVRMRDGDVVMLESGAGTLVCVGGWAGTGDKHFSSMPSNSSIHTTLLPSLPHSLPLSHHQQARIQRSSSPIAPAMGPP
jgi:hypothetical protein